MTIPTPLRRLLPITALAMVGAIAATASPACAQQFDTVHVRENGDVKEIDRTHVKSATYDKVEFERNSRTRDVKGADVVRIEWGDEPGDYRKAWNALASKEGLNAQKMFRACLDAQVAGDLREWVVEYSNLGLGEAYLLLGQEDAANYDKAVKAFEAARKSNPKSLVLDRIQIGLANAYIAQGNTPGAISAAKELLNAARTARRTDWELLALSKQARTELASGDHAAAARSYSSMARAAETALKTAEDAGEKRRLERARVEAAAAEGWVMIAKAEDSKAQGDWDAARNYFNQLSGQFGKKPEIQAAQTNAMGVIKLHEGDAEAARRLFVEAEVKFYLVSDEVARSLYHQAECLKKLGREEERDARIRELKQYYSDSEWALKL